MIQVASKYERRVDTRSYDDKKKLFEGVSILKEVCGTDILFKVLVISCMKRGRRLAEKSTASVRKP